jgi:hypothetical protein
VLLPDPHIFIFGTWKEDLFGLSTGETRQLPSFAETDGDGLYAVDDGRAPAVWEFGEYNGVCANQSTRYNINLGQDFALICDTTCVFVKGPNCPNNTFAMDPSFIDVADPPVIVSITGSGIDSTYGMPYIDYFDQYGNVVAEGRASQVAQDGTWLSGSTPDLSSVTSNTYSVIVRNVMADGSLQFVGAATVYVGNWVPPPPPPDPCDPVGDIQPICGNY